MTQEPPIPLLDLAAQNGPLAAELQEAFARVLRSNRFILGPEVEAFEQAVAHYVGATHAIGVSSGTDALVATLMALGIGPRDEVITTTFSFFATAGAIVRLGARPVFVDIDPATFNLDVQSVQEALTDRTRAIVAVHLFGQPASMEALSDLARLRNLAIVEDAAQAIGATVGMRAVGALGTAGCFSFFPSKNLGALGDGGLITTDDDALAERVRRIRVHGAKPKYFHETVGGNFRLDALQAAFLRIKLEHVDMWTRSRRRNAEHYGALFAEAGLPDTLLRLPKPIEPGHVYNQYVIQTSKRDELRKHLSDHRIATEIYYPLPLHLQPCFEYLGYRQGDMPVAERVSREALALPVYAELGEARVERIARTVVEFLRTAS